MTALDNHTQAVSALINHDDITLEDLMILHNQINIHILIINDEICKYNYNDYWGKIVNINLLKFQY